MRNRIQRANSLLGYLEPGELFAALALLYLAQFLDGGHPKVERWTARSRGLATQIGVASSLLAWLATLTECWAHCCYSSGSACAGFRYRLWSRCWSLR